MDFIERNELTDLDKENLVAFLSSNTWRKIKEQAIIRSVVKPSAVPGTASETGMVMAFAHGFVSFAPWLEEITRPGSRTNPLKPPHLTRKEP